MNKNIYVPSFWGGLFIVLISAIPGINVVNCMCGAGVIGGGIFTVYLHRRMVGPSEKITAKTGAVLGLLSGVIGACLSVVALYGFLKVFNGISYNLNVNSVGSEWADWLSSFDPQAFSRYAFLAIFAIILVISVLLSFVGGLIGVSLFGDGSGGQADKPTIRKKSKEDDDGIVVEDDAIF